MPEHPLNKNMPSQKKPELFSDFISNMNHLFGSNPAKGNGLLQSIDDFFMQSSQSRSFPIEVEETNQMYIVKAKLAGISKQQIDIEAYKQKLVITVKNQEIVKKEDSNKQISEYRQSNQMVQRSVTFVKPIDEKTITAGHNDGLLEIKVPKLKGTSVRIKP